MPIPPGIIGGAMPIGGYAPIGATGGANIPGLTPAGGSGTPAPDM